MICGIGTDICKTNRFQKWLKNRSFLNRFFCEDEILQSENEEFLCQHYAARFASKEAFSKALSTGIVGFTLKEVCIKNDEKGKPYFLFSQRLENKIKEIAGQNFKVHLTISHEKDYAVSFVIIESL